MVYIFEWADVDEVDLSSLLLLLDRESILAGGLRALLAGRCERTPLAGAGIQSYDMCAVAKDDPRRGKGGALVHKDTAVDRPI